MHRHRPRLFTGLLCCSTLFLLNTEYCNTCCANDQQDPPQPKIAVIAGLRIIRNSILGVYIDYWHLLDVTVYENVDEFFLKNPDGNKWYLTTKGAKRYDQASFCDGDYFIFGKETKGLPEELLHDNYDHALRIPMIADARSLNLSNSVAIVVYEAIRQNDHGHLLEQGHLTKF